MANSSVETDSESIISLLLIDINQPIELESKLFATDENKVSNFTSDNLESKFLAETNTDEMKDADACFHNQLQLHYSGKTPESAIIKTLDE